MTRRSPRFAFSFFLSVDRNTPEWLLTCAKGREVYVFEAIRDFTVACGLLDKIAAFFGDTVGRNWFVVLYTGFRDGAVFYGFEMETRFHEECLLLFLYFYQVSL